MNAAEYAALKTDHQKWQQCQDERDKLRTALAAAREAMRKVCGECHMGHGEGVGIDCGDQSCPLYPYRKEE